MLNKRFKRAVLDIETNGLINMLVDFTARPLKLQDHAKLWCISIRDFDNRSDVLSLVKDECTTEKLEEVLKDTEELIFHNGIGYDMIMLFLFGIMDYRVGYEGESDTIFKKKQKIKFVDTLLLSKLLRQDRFGGHSVEAWGRVLGVPKIDFHEFEEFSDAMVTYCITPDMRLLDTNLNWRPADTYSIGDVILGFDEEVQPGHHGRRYKNAVIEIINEDHQEVFEVLLESGKILKVTNEHRFLVSTNNHGFDGYHWVETKDLQPKEQFPTNFSQLPCLLPVYDQDMSYDSGWLGGMFDGEGSIVRGESDPPGLTIAQRPTPTLEKIERIMDQFDIPRSKRYVKKDSDCISLKVLGGLSEVYRALSICRPERLISELNFDTFGKLEMRGRSFNDPVVSIRSIGIQKILKIQTSSSTFMCEGYPMHNCEGDTLTQASIYEALLEELGEEGWDPIEKAYRMEIKLMDLTMRQELRGFYFNKELAEKAVIDFQDQLDTIKAKVDPLLPPRPLNKGEQAGYQPPKVQFKKNGDMSANMLKFLEKVEATVSDDMTELYFEDKVFPLPLEGCIKTTLPGSIDNLDYLKAYLLDLGWDPIEWKERDLTKDSKKVKLHGSKLDDTILRYVDNTLNGPYKKYRLEMLGIKDETQLVSFLLGKRDQHAIVVPVSPMIRIGTEKKLCDNLVALGEQASFAMDVTMYLTLKHRKNSIAGSKENEDGDPMTGYLSQVRPDHRISTPADTLGANGGRYKHRVVTN